MRRRPMVLFAVGMMIAAASLVTVAKPQVIEFLSYTGFPPTPVETVTIDGGQPCFISQGHGFLPEQIPAGMPPWRFAETYYSFQLKIGKELIAASSFNVHVDMFLARYWGVKKLWSATWKYHFPPGYFTPGTYWLTGVWGSTAPGDAYERQQKLLLVVE